MAFEEYREQIHVTGEELVEKVKGFGYDTSKLMRIPQKTSAH